MDAFTSEIGLACCPKANAGLTPALVHSLACRRLWSEMTAQNGARSSQNHWQIKGSGCHLGPSAQPRRGPWFPSNRSAITWLTGGGTAGAAGRALPPLLSYPGSSPRGQPFQKDPEDWGRASTHPPSAQSVECESGCLFLCRIQKCSGSHPKA